MASTTWKSTVIATAIPMLLVAASSAHAQSAPVESRWSFDAAIGWDNGISGNINSSGIGELNNQSVVIKANTYEEVYGTGLHMRFGGAYALSNVMEVNANITIQSLDADQVVPMGDIGVSNLYGKYTDYQTFGLDVGLRRYMNVTSSLRAYGEGTVGVGFIDETDLTLVAPGANLDGDVTDFYDQTAAMALGANVGVLYQMGGRLGFYGQLGLRWMSGMSEVDNLIGTGLDDINNKSSRWTLPFLTGVRVRF